jgi:hypothetical protein
MTTVALPYVGSGPYCMANSLAMMLGPGSPPPSMLQVLLGAPFGMQLLHGELPLFDPVGWDIDPAIDATLERLGWTCERTAGGGADEAMARLRKAVATRPAMVGPVEMGLLLHQPGSGTAIQADHWVVVADVDDEAVTFHDPHGHPYATLPAGAFATAWRAELIDLVDPPFVMRTAFTRVRRVDPLTALRDSLPVAIGLLAGRTDPRRPGSVGGAAAAEQLAGMVERGLDPQVHGHLVHFAIRAGARALSDAASCLALLGMTEAAAIADTQARLVGSLQYDVMAGNTAAAVATLRRLAPMYEQLRAALSRQVAG